MNDKQYEVQESAIQAGFFDKSVFKQESKLLLVLETGVAGLRHRVDKDSRSGKTLLKKLIPGTELFLYRDTENEHDKWAISIYTKDDKQLGYITRFKNEPIARLMDYGRKFVAYVDEPRAVPEDYTERRRTVAPTEDLKIPISIYLEDK
jgi:hypothetical protein